MEKYCKSCGRVFDDLKFKLCPYCGTELSIREGRQPIPRKLRHEVFKRDGYRCRECGLSKEETSLEIDHIIPVAKGGTNDIDNLQTLCRQCNRMKHTDEWVGGETDLKEAENELNVLKQQLKELKKSLKQTHNKDEILDLKFMIKILEKESIPKTQDKINQIIKDNEEFEAKIRIQQIEKEKKDKLFKKIYVELDYEIIVGLQNYFLINGTSTVNALRKLVDKYTEEEIYDAIDSVKRDLELNTKKSECPVIERLKRLYGIKFCPICDNELPKIANECYVCGTKLIK